MYFENNLSVFCNSISVKNREWSLREMKSFGKVDGISTEAVDLAYSRGFDPNTFFNPTLKQFMPNPSLLKGMDDAVNLFCDSVLKNKKFAVYGDYDVDGATSTSLVMRWLLNFNVNAIFYIPDRLKEGYGPNVNAVEKLKNEHNVDIIVFLDSGTTAHEPMKKAKELGLDVIIVDHHEPNQNMPEGILVNPKRLDETREFSYLCTAGLAFLFLVAVQREMRKRNYFNENREEIDLRNWLGIVALGTVADVVPLVDLNRAYAYLGFDKMNLIPGIKALSIVTSTDTFNSRTCGFVFGPCINATGRIGDTRLGTKLLLTDDFEEAMKLAIELHETNIERQKLQNQAVDVAMEEAKQYLNDKVIIISNNNWHPGIVGLIASRIKDAFNKPTIAIGENGTASCRSIEGFDIGRSVIKAYECKIIRKGGGHTMAAGLSVDYNRISDLREFMNKEASDFIQPPILIDMFFHCGNLNVKKILSLETLQPFGAGNLKPIVSIVGGKVKSIFKMSGGRHIKVTLSGEFGENEVIVWNADNSIIGKTFLDSVGKYVDVIGECKVDEFGGRIKSTLIVEDIMVGNDSSLF